MAASRPWIAQPDGALTTATYDATGLVLTTRTPGNVTIQYDYDTRGLNSKTTEGVGVRRRGGPGRIRQPGWPLAVDRQS